MDDPAALSREIYDSEAFQIQLRLETLAVNYFVLQRNYEEIKILLMAVQHPNTFDQVWAPNKQQEMKRVLREVTRMLHNLVASAKTLVEHTRILIKEWYADTEFLRDYEIEVKKRFAGNPTVGFIEDLRNFGLHFRLPLISALFEIKNNPDTNEATAKQSIILDKSNLLQWQGWTAKGKIYLESANDRIGLEEVIDRYFQDVNDFHQWMRDRLVGIHSNELKWLEDMTRRVDEALKKRGQ